MVEIVIREQLDKPLVIRMPNKLPQIHIGANMRLSQITKGIASEISDEELKKFKQLFCDDSYPREFLHENNYLKIMDKK